MIMKTKLLGAVCGAIAGIVLTSHAQIPNSLRIYTALEVEYESEVGKKYMLQGAVNLTNWTDIGEIVYGNGRTVNQTFSTKGGGSVSFASYRLKIVDATNGY